MLEDEDYRPHYVCALRQKLGSSDVASVAYVLRGVERMAVNCLDEVIPPTLDRDTKLAYAYSSLPYSKPRWELDRADGPFSVGELLETLKSLYKSAGDEDERCSRDKLKRWYAAAEVLRCCIEIRRHGLNQGRLNWLTDAMHGLPAQPMPKASEAKGSSASPGEPLGPRSGQAPTSSGSEAHDFAPPEPAAPRLRIERRARRVTLDGRSIRLSPQSFKLLLFLAERTFESPAALDSRDLEDHLWPSGRHPLSGIREAVRVLRKALRNGAEDQKPAKALIENSHSNGYRLALPTGEIEIKD